jgi:hypothetical protein
METPYTGCNKNIFIGTVLENMKNGFVCFNIAVEPLTADIVGRYWNMPRYYEQDEKTREKRFVPILM